MKINNIQIGNLKMIETGKLYGNMNSNKNFFPEEYTVQQRKDAFTESRRMLGEDYGFDPNKFFMADQLDKRGTWFEIDDEYALANPNGWSDIRQDILITKTSGIAIGHPIADCLVVIAYDKKQDVVSIGHCSAELVDKKMPMLVVDALFDSYRSKDEDIITLVSACAGKSWKYDKYPSWAKDNKIWEKCIEEENGIFHIDLKKAVLTQLTQRNVKDIIMSDIDTILDDRFYSNSAEFNGNLDKKGRNFAGAVLSKRR